MYDAYEGIDNIIDFEYERQKRADADADADWDYMLNGKHGDTEKEELQATLKELRENIEREEKK